MADQVRLASVSKVAAKLDVDVETVRRWCRRGDVKCELTPGGRGQWRIEIDTRGVPVRR